MVAWKKPNHTAVPCHTTLGQNFYKNHPNDHIDCSVEDGNLAQELHRFLNLKHLKNMKAFVSFNWNLYSFSKLNCGNEHHIYHRLYPGANVLGSLIEQGVLVTFSFTTYYFTCYFYFCYFNFSCKFLVQSRHIDLEWPKKVSTQHDCFHLSEVARLEKYRSFSL